MAESNSSYTRRGLLGGGAAALLWFLFGTDINTSSLSGAAVSAYGGFGYNFGNTFGSGA